jgi:hypothetical protein
MMSFDKSKIAAVRHYVEAQSGQLAALGRVLRSADSGNGRGIPALSKPFAEWIEGMKNALKMLDDNPAHMSMSQRLDEAERVAADARNPWPGLLRKENIEIQRPAPRTAGEILSGGVR